jgi:hypothetical protein
MSSTPDTGRTSRKPAGGAIVRRLAGPAILFLAALLPVSSRAQWITDLETGVLANSNLGNATAGPDVHSAAAWTASVATGFFYELAPGSTVFVSGQARQTDFNKYVDEDNLDLGMSARLDHKFGLGREAPHVYLSGSATHLDFRDSLRNGWLGNLTLGARSLFGERLTLRGEAGVERRTGNNDPVVRPGFPGNVFDQSNRIWTLGADYSATDTVLLQAALSWRRGATDYVETTTPADSFDGDLAATRDPAFGPNAFVVKTPVRAQVIDVGASWALGQHASLNVIFRRQFAVDTTGTLYTRSIPSLSYEYRFD